MNFIIQKLKSKHISLKKYTNYAKLTYFSLILREREEKKTNISHLSQMKQHIDTVHKGLKKHQCHICKKDLSLRSSLLKHIRAVHEKQKPYKCESCDSSFAQGAHLRAHVTAIHLG